MDGIVRDRSGKWLQEGDRVRIAETTGVIEYDRAFWAYVVRGDDGKRYLLMDILTTCIDPGDGGFAWEQIVSTPEQVKEREDEDRPAPSEGS